MLNYCELFEILKRLAMGTLDDPSESRYHVLSVPLADLGRGIMTAGVFFCNERETYMYGSRASAFN